VELAEGGGGFQTARPFGEVVNRSRFVSVVGLGIAGSQAGHLFVYQLIYGPAAGQVQSAGAHAYFPLLAKSTLGVVAVALLACLLIIGAGRIAGAKRAPVGPPYLSLLAALFTVQLACFVCQEVGEALAAGSGVASAPRLVLFGTLGQLPIAMAGALALKWLWARVEAAADAIRFALGPQPFATLPSLATAGVWITPDSAVFARMRERRAHVRRGPPRSF